VPRGDGTGPMGMGPMTGRAAGYCAGYPMPGFMNPYGGRSFGRGYAPYAAPYGGLGAGGAPGAYPYYAPFPGRGLGMAWGRGGGRGMGMASRRGWGRGGFGRGRRWAW
jgi:hypothetical protein